MQGNSENYRKRFNKIQERFILVKKDFYFSELFVLKKQGKNKWKKVKFSEKAVFCKTIVARSGKSITVKLKWKKFFGKNLSKGKYKIKFVKTKSFKIK